MFKSFYKFVGRDQHGRKFSSQKPQEGEIKVEHKDSKKGGKFGDDFKGGDYIDYEEVK